VPQGQKMSRNAAYIAHKDLVVIVGIKWSDYVLKTQTDSLSQIILHENLR